MKLKIVFSPFKFKNDRRKLEKQDGLFSIVTSLGYGIHAGESGDDFRRALTFLSSLQY
jgi:hypothetical protein